MKSLLIVAAVVVVLTGVGYYVLIPDADDVAFAAINHCELLELRAQAEQGPVSDELAEGLRYMTFNLNASIETRRAPSGIARALRNIDCEQVPEFDWSAHLGSQPE